MSNEVQFETMTIENIMDEMDPLVTVDPQEMNLDQISLKIGRSFMVAQRHYVREGRYLEHIIHQQNRMDMYLRRYYAGELPPHVYKEKPLKVKALKSELDMWVKADDMYIELVTLLQEQKSKIKFIESCFDRLKKLGYEVKNAIEWRKYLDGM